MIDRKFNKLYRKHKMYLWNLSEVRDVKDYTKLFILHGLIFAGI